MKLHRLLLGIATVYAAPLHAFTQLGNGDLFLEGRFDFIYDSNLFLREQDSEDDFMGILYTGLGFTQQERSVLNVELNLGVEIIRMYDFSEENAEDLKTDFSISYPNNVERDGYVELSGGWNENTQANADVGQRIETEDKRLDGQFHQKISDKVGLEFSASWLDQNYRNVINPDENERFDRDSQTNTFGVVAAYQYSEKLFATLLYQYRDLSYGDDLSSEQTGNVLAVGGRGQLFPKVSGGVFIGIQDIDLNSPVLGKESYADPFYSLDLTWTPRDKTAISLSGSSNFQASVFGDTNNRNDLQLQVAENLSDKASMNGAIVYSNNNYEGLFEDRVDKSIIYTVGYRHTLNNLSFLNGRLSYEDRNSNLEVLSFKRFLASVGLSVLW